MKIFMLSAEVFPFAKTGGLSDAVSSLSKSLRDSGDEVKILLPRYYGIPREKLRKVFEKVPVPLGDGEVFVDFYMTSLPGSDVEVYLSILKGFSGATDFTDLPPTLNTTTILCVFLFLQEAFFRCAKNLAFRLT